VQRDVEYSQGQPWPYTVVVNDSGGRGAGGDPNTDIVVDKTALEGWSRWCDKASGWS